MTDRVLEALSLVAAVAIVGSGMYLLLDKAAPIVKQNPAPPVHVSAPSAAPPAHVAPPSRTATAPSSPGIYRCQVDGAAVYSDSPCQGGRLVEVQVTKGYDSQQYLRQSYGQGGEAAPSASPTSAVEQPQSSANAGLCAQINKVIESIDAAARTGGTIQHMEYLKEERRKLVNQRQELNC